MFWPQILFVIFRPRSAQGLLIGLSHFTPDMLAYFSERCATLDPLRAEAFRHHCDEWGRLQAEYR